MMAFLKTSGCLVLENFRQLFDEIAANDPDTFLLDDSECEKSFQLFLKFFMENLGIKFNTQKS